MERMSLKQNKIKKNLLHKFEVGYLKERWGSLARTQIMEEV
jgi:hypothetical protein